MQTVDLTIGWPGCGKSYWAHHQATEHETVIVCRDSIRMMLRGTYAFDKRDEGLVMEIAEASVLAALERGRNVIIDETNVTKKRRSSWCRLVRGFEAEVQCPSIKIRFIDFMGNDDTLDRRMNEPRGYDRQKWAGVIAQMKRNYQAVSKDEDWQEHQLLGEDGEILAVSEKEGKRK